jgi:hypothetical protein
MRGGIVKITVVALALFGVLFGAAAFLVSNLVIGPPGGDEHPPSGPPPRLFPAAVGSSWGFIDETGTMVVPLQFSRAETFSEGLALVELNGKVAYIDDSGRVAVCLEKAVAARAFSDGLAEVRDGRLWGYIDRSGTFVIKPQFQWTFPFTEGVASVRKSVDSEYYPIDKTGKPLSITPPDADCHGFVIFREGLSECAAGNGLWGYFDHGGRWVISPTFSWAGDFSEGLAYARPPGKRTKWGYIDRKGKWAIRPQFLGAGCFSEGLAAVRVFTFSFPPFKWGFIDRQGHLAIPATYDGVTPFCGGLAFVEKRRKVGFIDRTGQIVVPLQLDAGGYFSGPLAPVVYSDKSGKKHNAYINKKGQIVWVSPNVVHFID